MDADVGASDTIEEYISREFVVSQSVIRRRVEFDELWGEVT